ncbi:MAG TPA: ABC transporter ATP-binding protein [Candidatus Dormibacteraeota bacterium]|jgi:ABC-2 type transport system ATP-binding protein|nr:ABC transporter ATP-binding protein [Candidatus Dormibacteraeota bacterium]
MPTQIAATLGSRTAPALLARGLTKRYGSVLAVDRLDLAVRPGEVYGFLGPNGAGKTTTMRMLVGLIRPTAGSARVAGRDAGDPRGLAHVGAMVETPALYPYLSGRDNLAVLAGHGHVPRSRIGEVLDQVGLTDRAGDRFAGYSLGMKQRLGVGAALLKDPSVLILDEPTNGLDPAGIADMRVMVRRLGDEGRAVLLSSHQLGDVEQICDRVGVILHGRLVAEGTVDEIRGGAGLAVVATPDEMARARLTELLGAGAVSSEDGVIRLRVDPERAPEINRALVAAGIDVHELRRDERSLEEVFLAMSAGDRDEEERSHAA